MDIFLFFFSQKNQDKGKIARTGDLSMVEAIEAEGYETVSTLK